MISPLHLMLLRRKNNWIGLYFGIKDVLRDILFCNKKCINAQWSLIHIINPIQRAVFLRHISFKRITLNTVKWLKVDEHWKKYSSLGALTVNTLY